MDTVAFEMRFTGGGLPNFGAIAYLDAPPADVTVTSDGSVFLNNYASFSNPPVVTLWGHGEELVDGWVNNSVGLTGEMPFTVCSGYPLAECWSREIYIPASGRCP